MLQGAKGGGVFSTLTEQRMAEQMNILDKFYERYDSQQWAAVLEMETEVLFVAREMRDDLTVVRVAGGIYGRPFGFFTQNDIYILRYVWSSLLCSCLTIHRGGIFCRLHSAHVCVSCIRSVRAQSLSHTTHAGYLGNALDSLGQRDRALEMHKQARIIAKEVMQRVRREAG